MPHKIAYRSLIAQNRKAACYRSLLLATGRPLSARSWSLRNHIVQVREIGPRFAVGRRFDAMPKDDRVVELDVVRPDDLCPLEVVLKVRLFRADLPLGVFLRMAPGAVIEVILRGASRPETAVL